jgi:hypothetical protein
MHQSCCNLNQPGPDSREEMTLYEDNLLSEDVTRVNNPTYREIGLQCWLPSCLGFKLTFRRNVVKASPFIQDSSRFNIQFYGQMVNFWFLSRYNKR